MVNQRSSDRVAGVKQLKSQSAPSPARRSTSRLRSAPVSEPSPSATPDAMPLIPPVRPTVHRKPPITKLFMWFGLLLMGSLTAATVGTTLALVTPIPGVIAPKEGQNLLGDLWKNGFQYRVARPVNILVMGIDRVPGAAAGSQEMFSGRSDTMLLLRIDPTDSSVNLLSVPRDTQVEIPGIGVTKINQANASGGPLLARETVSQTLNGVAIDRYVRVSTDAFRELVDLLGGIEVYVPAPMSYTDKTQKLKIELSPGQQILDGNKAEQFARFRHDAQGDIGRVQRQQALIKALRSKITNPLIIPRVPGLISAMQKHIDTNLSTEEMLALVGVGMKLNKDSFKMVMLPGRFSRPEEFNASYWIMDPSRRDRVMQQFFKIPVSGGVVDPAAPLSGSLTSDIKIAVQNASSSPEAADQFVQYLSSLGYTNVYAIKGLRNSQRRTQIIVQKGDLDAAKMMQSALHFGVVEANSTGDLESDLTIQVGDDWVRQKALR